MKRATREIEIRDANIIQRQKDKQAETTELEPDLDVAERFLR
jgi:hypothetical protein